MPAGDYYGTPAEPVRRVLDRGGTVLLDVEPNGAFQVLEKLPQAVMVFLAPPSLAELRRRLESRGDTPPDKVEARLKQAHWGAGPGPPLYIPGGQRPGRCMRGPGRGHFAGRPGGRSLPL